MQTTHHSDRPVNHLDGASTSGRTSATVPDDLNNREQWPQDFREAMERLELGVGDELRRDIVNAQITADRTSPFYIVSPREMRALVSAELAEMLTEAEGDFAGLYRSDQAEAALLARVRDVLTERADIDAEIMLRPAAERDFPDFHRELDALAAQGNQNTLIIWSTVKCEALLAMEEFSAEILSEHIGPKWRKGDWQGVSPRTLEIVAAEVQIRYCELDAILFEDWKSCCKVMSREVMSWKDILMGQLVRLAENMLHERSLRWEPFSWTPGPHVPSLCRQESEIRLGHYFEQANQEWKECGKYGYCKQDQNGPN